MARVNRLIISCTSLSHALLLHVVLHIGADSVGDDDAGHNDAFNQLDDTGRDAQTGQTAHGGAHNVQEAEQDGGEDTADGTAVGQNGNADAEGADGELKV